MDLKLANGDLVIENGDVTYVSGLDAVIQALEYRLRTFLGENKFDQNVGAPWLEIMGGRNATEDELALAATSTALTVLGITEAVPTGVVIENKQATISMSCRALDQDFDFSTRIAL